MMTKKDTRESYEACLKRHLTTVKGMTKTAATDKLLARHLAAADVQRGHARAPARA